MISKSCIARKEFPGNGKEWLRWAEMKADWYDPNIESYDELLADVDRNTLDQIT
ncbi:hypothetical protein GCM10011425_29760 [Mucilaginibacter galii]|uniref:Uncharacterized protein n=1 Tax=Mucilaginibacter galii TaxID=2005073 RepID=A0A917JDK9_9SPHI|nr:hypothetical protein GCM10011425_29760 [Mucilaginibacter galii]